MELRGIKAPLMIVKSDGSLMTDAMARSKPIETILSGPAASVIGGIFLSGQQDAFVMDIGGTTTDIANVSDGHLNIRDEGAKVGGWYTRARAVEVFTSGLGGDSRIYVDSHKKIRIDTCKSIPLCMDVASFVGYEMVEHYIIEDLCGARMAFSFGGLLSEIVPRMSFALAMEKLYGTPDHPFVTYYNGSTNEQWDHDIEANYGLGASEMLIESIINLKYNMPAIRSIFIFVY